jgi:hypothetical protein
MKKTTSPYEITNSFPGSRPYTTSDKESETKDMIYYKYGSTANQYVKEASSLQNTFLDKYKKVWQDVVSNKTGNQPKQWTGAEWDYKAKILEKESVQNKLHGTIEKLGLYKSQLEHYSVEIECSDDVSIADMLFGQVKTYHDSNIGNLFTHVDDILHEFEIEAVGILGE